MLLFYRLSLKFLSVNILDFLNHLSFPEISSEEESGKIGTEEVGMYEQNRVGRQDQEKIEKSNRHFQKILDIKKSPGVFL